MALRHHQKLYSSPIKKSKALPLVSSSTALSTDGYEKGGFFTYRGEDTGYFYTSAGDRLSVFQSNGHIEEATLAFTIPFGPKASVIDCIYFPLNDKSPGLVVAVFDPTVNELRTKHYLAYVSLTKRRVLKKVAAPGVVNSIANIIDGATYPSQVNGLHSAFQEKWPHVIGVSIRENGAALTHLGMTCEDDEHIDELHKATNTIFLGKNFVNGADTFEFRDDNGKSYSGKRANFFVSKFAFIERCAIVIMGFPFGGIYMVSLRTQRPYAFFVSHGVIEDIALQDADDDPRGFFYVWYALSRGEKAHALSSFAMFSEEDLKNKNYDYPQFNFSVNFVLNDYESFISVKTMLVDRARLAGSPKEADSSGNDSIIANTKSSSLALFTWLSASKPSKICGALFDLNMFYFKRCPSRLSPDDTELRQIACCAGFQSDESIDVKNMKIFDLLLMPNSLHAFVSVDNEDKDQIFYPSVYSYTIKALTHNRALYLNIDSIQDQYLKQVNADFIEHWKQPTEACIQFNALGISELPYETNDKRYYYLNTLLKHAYHFCISDFILDPQTSVPDLKFILKWLNKEMEVNKETLDRFCQPLLNGSEISHSAMHFIKFSEHLFYRISQLIDSLIERVQKKEEEEDLLKLLKVASSIANGVYLYSIGIKFGLEQKMLPQTSRFLNVNKDLKKLFDERILNNNGSKGTLAILRLTRECMDSAPDASIWGNKSAQQWYPPQDYSTWLGLYLMVNLSKTAKATIFGYYLYDLHKQGLWRDDKLLDKGLGYFLSVDSDKLLAIKRRIEKMYKADEQLSEDDTDVVLAKVVHDMKNPQDETPKTLEDFSNLSLITHDQIETAKQHFLNLPHGVHHWNISVINKRRYELILPTDSPKEDEPTIVQESRKKVAEIQRKQPWLFRKNSLLNDVKKWVDETSNLQKESTSRKIDVSEIPISRKRTIDEVITTEEDIFQLATPIKQVRKSLFADTPAAKAFKEFAPSPNENLDITMSPVGNADIDNKAMTDKQWERIKQITKTPPTTPMVSRLLLSPPPSTVKPPTSILRSNKKQSRITPGTKRLKLQFEDTISQVKSIPNRHEQKAPLPDAFTMDESSIISEVEYQQEPLMDDDSMEDKEHDLSYGPVKLNFDVIGDEDDDMSEDEEGRPIMKLAKEDAAVVDKSVEQRNDTVLMRSFEAQEEEEEDDDESLPDAEQSSEPETPEKEHIHAEEMADNNILIRSFEAQEEEDDEFHASDEKVSTNEMIEKKHVSSEEKGDHDILVRSFEAQEEEEDHHLQADNEPQIPSTKEKVVKEQIPAIEKLDLGSSFADEWRLKNRRPVSNVVPLRRSTRRTLSHDSVLQSYRDNTLGKISLEPVKEIPEPSPLKRGGRTRKSSLEPLEEIIHSSPRKSGCSKVSSLEPVQEESSPRKRGRPRKPSVDPPESTTPPPSPRKSGGNKVSSLKHVQEESSPSKSGGNKVSSLEPVQEESSPRKRGRPRKPSVDPPESTTPPPSPRKSGGNKVSSLKPVQEESSPRKRGRPRKSIV